MPVNYDKIAGFYDLLSRVVFGKNILNVQLSLIKFIPAGSNVLIIAGGTGWILEELAKQHPAGLKIDYLESSARMISLSKSRNWKGNALNFIHLPIENFTGLGLYDVIFTPFVFDNFRAEKTELIFKCLQPLLVSKGLWLNADFVFDKYASPLWQKMLLKIMYLFFRITCNIETNEVINPDPYFEKRYEKIYEVEYYFRFIKGVVYKKL